jgi:hypothetical protein
MSLRLAQDLARQAQNITRNNSGTRRAVSRRMRKQ